MFYNYQWLLLSQRFIFVPAPYFLYDSNSIITGPYLQLMRTQIRYIPPSDYVRWSVSRKIASFVLNRIVTSADFALKICLFFQQSSHQWTLCWEGVPHYRVISIQELGKTGCTWCCGIGILTPNPYIGE